MYMMQRPLTGHYIHTLANNDFDISDNIFRDDLLEFN